MTQKQQRYSLKSKKAKQLLNKLSEILNFDVKTYFDPKINIEIVKSSFGNIYLVNDKPLFFEIKNRVLPTLMFQEFILQAPTIVVDMGAIPYVCNGADVMAPGIVQVKGDFEKGGLVLIIDEKHGKPIALGESLYDSKTVRSAKKGAVIRTIHFVSDKIWNFAKALTS